ncbi:MAG: nicotinamide mononucleotide transporter [Clostridiales bacterium]|nr:nicotinamide mononucleotide transporter [Clostridiales bacterium]
MDLAKDKKENKIKKLWNYFSTYEKLWFISIAVLAVVFAFVFPEEDVGGVNGTIIMILYLVDILSNILCELLISKQSKWNFIVSLIVELTEIAICIVCAYRFATMAVTIFFWIPIDIISFFAWQKHKDKKEENITEVRKLTWWQDLILILGIAVWTVVVGYLLSLIEYEGILSYNEVIQDLGGYLDACASAIGIANGVFILLRYREQWICWYLVTFLEIVLNIMAGQWILLVLKAGYLTNTTYGYIKWTKYIKGKQTTLPPTQIKGAMPTAATAEVAQVQEEQIK